MITPPNNSLPPSNKEEGEILSPPKKQLTKEDGEILSDEDETTILQELYYEVKTQAAIDTCEEELCKTCSDVFFTAVT